MDPWIQHTITVGQQTVSGLHDKLRLLLVRLLFSDTPC